ncbi:MAG: bifunctional folylpolyglutamate synthase/dihydrofolate synthase [Candidatus Omnitrophica bacterium]|nr:bifunctional folylpolyglutamate synthase/dihydrofolate synthase [Candidatus Omnitrophota bacterium]MBU4457989.1 bifunctional folylpolyglutamate synthase/dihydrofolate synthase [Candidatus Omnitrophota bacterium]
MNYSTALDYVNSFIDFEKIPQYSYASSFNLERMHAFLKDLGNPHQALKVIHVAGSKGKGSTCAMIASILKEAGYSVGLYTSPHLIDTRERIRVLNEVSGVPVPQGYGAGRCSRTTGVRGRQVSKEFEGVIGREEFIELIEGIRPVAEKFRDHEKLGRLSFFEILTACAFLYFKEKKVDFAVLETGLGGRLDATNVTWPVVCGITSISMEHRDKLGDSLELIAREKAGIIKVQGSRLQAPGAVFTVWQKKEVIDVIREVCREKNAKLHKVSKNLPYENLELALLGRHQIENAGLAIAMARFIDNRIDEKAIRNGLKNVNWPGRLQIVQKEPYVVLDGAQNVASIDAVLSSIKEIFEYKRLICIFGISSDKDIKGVCGVLDSACDIIILTRSRSERAKDPTELKKHFSRVDALVTGSVEEALAKGLDRAGKGDLILITGSLYVVGEALRTNYTA